MVGDKAPHLDHQKTPTTTVKSYFDLLKLSNISLKKSWSEIDKSFTPVIKNP